MMNTHCSPCFFQSCRGGQCSQSCRCGVAVSSNTAMMNRGSKRVSSRAVWLFKPVRKVWARTPNPCPSPNVLRTFGRFQTLPTKIFKTFSKHSLVLMAIRKNDNVCDDVFLETECQSTDEAEGIHHSPSSTVNDRRRRTHAPNANDTGNCEILPLWSC